MTTSRNAYLPSPAALDAVVAQVICYHVESLMKEGLPGLQAALHVYVQGQCVASKKLAIPDTANEIVPAELRSEFRSTIDPRRSLFMVQAMLDQPIQGLGFSGFKVKGELRDNAGAWVARVKSVVGHYKVTAWSPW